MDQDHAPLLAVWMGCVRSGDCIALGTVAILAQGTSWAVAVTQAFLGAGSSPSLSITPSTVGVWRQCGIRSGPSADALMHGHHRDNAEWNTELD